MGQKPILVFEQDIHARIGATREIGRAEDPLQHIALIDAHRLRGGLLKLKCAKDLQTAPQLIAMPDAHSTQFVFSDDVVLVVFPFEGRRFGEAMDDALHIGDDARAVIDRHFDDGLSGGNAIR